MRRRAANGRHRLVRQTTSGPRRTTPRVALRAAKKNVRGRQCLARKRRGNTHRTSLAVTTQRPSRHRAIKPQSPRHCLARTNLAATSTGRTHRSKTQGATAVSHDAEKVSVWAGIRTHACTSQSKRYVSGWECSRRRRRHTCAPGDACERACTTRSPRAPYRPTKGGDGRCATSCGQSDASAAKARHNVRWCSAESCTHCGSVRSRLSQDTDGPAADALPHTGAIGAKARHFRSRLEWIRSRLRCDPRRTISRPAMSAKFVDRDTLVGWPRRSGSVLNTAIW